MKDSQAQEDIWHLTLDDLWAAPPAENPRLGGDGPFVINLSTSPAPISVPPKDELYIENISVYVLSHNEDGRQRFRLRLGPISTELEADAILSAVRERYPGAMTATASEEDLRAIGHATRNIKGAKPAAAPPAAPKQSIERNGPKPVGKPVETKVAVRPTEPKVEATVAPRPAEPKAEVKVATRPPAPKAEPKPAAKADHAHIVMLPPAPVIDQRDDSDEPTGTGWEIDSLLPHLSGSAPEPKAKPPAAKAAQVARKVAPPAQSKTPVAAKPAPQAPAAQRALAVAPPAPAALAKTQVPAAPRPPVLTAAVETPQRVVAPPAPPVAKTVAAPIVEPAAPAAPIAAVVPPPVVEASTPRPVVEVATPPVVEAAKPPIVEAAAVSPVEPAPPLIAKVAPPPASEPAPQPVNVAEPTPAPDTKPSLTATVHSTPAPAAMRQAPAATALPPLTVRNPRIELRKSHAIKAEPAKPAVAEKPVAVTPTVPEKEKPPAAAILAADTPPADPLETDWAAILSAHVEDTQSRRALHAPAPPEPATAPTAKATDDSGLQRLVERSNALVKQMDTQVDAVATESPIVTATLISPPEPMPPVVAAIAAAEPVVTEQAHVPITATQDPSPIAAEPTPPGVIFSPLNTQSIEQKLAKLAEILHGGSEAEATAPAAPPPAPVFEAAAQSEPAPVPSVAESDFDVEISFDDDLFATPAPATTPWFEADRRHEPRPTLKSPGEVLSSIEEMVVVDEANNLTDVMARQKVPVIDATAETDRRPALVLAEEPKSQDAPPAAPKLEIAVVEAPIAEPTPAAVAPAIVVATELTLEPELTLSPAEPVPPPVLTEERIVEKPAQTLSLEILAEPVPASHAAETVIVPKLPELEFTIDDPVPAVAAAPAPKAKPEPKLEVAAPSPTVAAVSVVSTVVLDDPAPKPRAEEPRVPTVVLEPTPVVIRSHESATDHAAKDARHLSARAAARAAKKIRLAKDAAKKAAAAAARSNGAEPAKANAEPAVTTHPPAQPAAAAEPPSPPQPVHAPTAAPAHAPVRVPAHAPAPAPSNKKGPQVPQKKPAARPQPAAAKPQPSTPKHVHVPTRPAASPPAAKQPLAAPMRPAASGERKVTIRSEHSASMDSTQTIRALTPLELADHQISKWYVIQLAISEDDFDPDQIPQLDIFDAFRLYSVIGLDGPKILHALRLGFFSDEISAQAVHGYLKAHFEASAVKRVSIAERERFAESQVEARKDIGATGMHAIIEMASPTPVPETRLADLKNTANQRPAEEKSIWSRLVSPLKRQ